MHIYLYDERYHLVRGDKTLGLAIGIVLSVGAVDALIPLMIIVILIVAAAGATRGYSIFNVFGIATLAGIGAGKGSIQGRSALGRFFLMGQRPGTLGMHPKGKLKSRIKAMRQSGMKVGPIRVRGSLEKSMRAEERTSRGAVSPKVAGKARKSIKMAVMGGDKTRRRRIITKVIGTPGSSGRKIARKLAWIVPPAGAYFSYKNYSRNRRGQGKSRIPLKTNDPTKRGNPINKQLEDLEKQKKQHEHYRAAVRAYSTGGISSLQSARDAKMRPARIKMNKADEAFARGDITKGERDRIVAGAQREMKSARSSISRSTSGRGINMVVQGRHPYGQEDVADAVLGVRLAKTRAAKDATEMHVKKMVDLEDGTWAKSDPTVTYGGRSAKLSSFTPKEQKAILKRELNAAEDGFRKTVQNFQRENGIRGPRPFTRQADAIRTTAVLGRSVAKATVIGTIRKIRHTSSTDSDKHMSAQEHIQKDIMDPTKTALRRSVLHAAGFDPLRKKERERREKEKSEGSNEN